MGPAVIAVEAEVGATETSHIFLVVLGATTTQACLLKSTIGGFLWAFRRFGAPPLRWDAQLYPLDGLYHFADDHLELFCIAPGQMEIWYGPSRVEPTVRAGFFHAAKPSRGTTEMSPSKRDYGDSARAFPCCYMLI